MLERIGQLIKNTSSQLEEYLPYCIPFHNIAILQSAQKTYFQAALSISPSVSFKQALNEVNAIRDGVIRKYDIGLLTQAVVAISALALSLLFTPATSVGAIGKLCSLTVFALFAISAAASISARALVTNKEMR